MRKVHVSLFINGLSVSFETKKVGKLQEICVQMTEQHRQVLVPLSPFTLAHA